MLIISYKIIIRKRSTKNTIRYKSIALLFSEKKKQYLHYSRGKKYFNPQVEFTFQFFENISLLISKN